MSDPLRMRTRFFWNRILALLLTAGLVAPSPSFALRVSQLETPLQRAGLEEPLKPDEAEQPNPQFLNHLTQLARTFSGNYKLTLVLWEPQPTLPYDWPQWRLIPSSNQLQYVPEDFERFPGQNLLWLSFEAIAVATAFHPEVVEEEYQTQWAFWALMTALAIPWARLRLLNRFEGALETLA